MEKTCQAAEVFDQNALEYDSWFDRHPILFKSEIGVLKKAIPSQGEGLEIGVGTGRFAQALGITQGIEPSDEMAKLAESRGVKVLRGKGEALPYLDQSFDFVLMVTTLCFLNDIPKAFSEAWRVLKPGGKIILAIIDKNSPLGKKYQQQQSSNKFYRDAHFHSTAEVTGMLVKIGFQSPEYWQTLTAHNELEVEDPKPGFGEGSFVVIKAGKS